MSAAPTVEISVVVPALDAEDSIGDMLTGLGGQAGVDRGRWEVIVVDGGSRDRTREVARRHGATVLVEPIRGPAAARNLGLARARGELICHLDADSVPTRHWLREMVAPFADPQTVLVGGKTLSLPSETAAQRYMARSGRIDSLDYINRPLFPFVPSRNMAVRRAAALEIGGWVNELITGEDVDFCHRLLATFPQPAVYQARAVLLHKNRETDEGLRRQAWSYGEGTAHLYQRYPDEVRWRVADDLRVAGKLATRAATAASRRLLGPLGKASDEDVELARYHWLWGEAFWRGFYSYRLTRAYRRREQR